MLRTYANNLDKIANALNKDIKKHLPNDCRFYAVMAYDKLKHDVVEYLSEAAKSIKYYARKNKSHK